MSNLPFARTQPAALERIQHTQQFSRAATDTQIVHDLKLQDTIWVNDEHTAQSQLLACDIHPVRIAHVATRIACQRKSNRPKPAAGWPGRQPAVVRLEIVSVNTKDTAASLFELLDATAHGGQFGWSYHGEVAGIEQKHHPAVEIILEADCRMARSRSLYCRQRKTRRPRSYFRFAFHRRNCTDRRRKVLPTHFARQP